ncbi:uncharacterized protein LOC133711323 [Rosa rugosa]|uniref:uncharacterized protein LOC133711323 n=1 Tax=Rosa rugosa TaxID=74645 RepID=UPI002B40F7BE|nr:uncharacterized protein LOC133711323 [Rosa rugosa]
MMWALSPFSSIISTWKENSVMEFFDHASWVLVQEELDLFAFIMWRIWHDRNKWVFENKRFDALYSYKMAKSSHDEYRAVMISKGRGAKEKQKRWKPPSQGFVKVNTDGAFVPNNRVGGAGVVIRNNRGEIAVARTIPLFGVTTPRHAEILAISCRLQLALEQGYSALELESDAQAIIQAIQTYEENLAIDGHLVESDQTTDVAF